MKSEVIDTVFADPPFNIGKDYKNGYNDKKTKSEYLTWCREWILECCRILKPGGAFFLYATPELAVQFAPIMGEQLDFRHWIALTMKGTYPRGKSSIQHIMPSSIIPEARPACSISFACPSKPADIAVGKFETMAATATK